jgi:hypothetical protein
VTSERLSVSIPLSAKRAKLSAWFGEDSPSRALKLATIVSRWRAGGQAGATQALAIEYGVPVEVIRLAVELAPDE